MSCLWEWAHILNLMINLSHWEKAGSELLAPCAGMSFSFHLCCIRTLQAAASCGGPDGKHSHLKWTHPRHKTNQMCKHHEHPVQICHLGSWSWLTQLQSFCYFEYRVLEDKSYTEIYWKHKLYLFILKKRFSNSKPFHRKNLNWNIQLEVFCVFGGLNLWKL